MLDEKTSGNNLGDTSVKVLDCHSQAFHSQRGILSDWSYLLSMPWYFWVHSNVLLPHYGTWYFQPSCCPGLETRHSYRLTKRAKQRKGIPMRRREVLVTLASGLLLSSCGSQSPSANNVSGSSGRSIPQPKAGRGLIVFYRPSRAAGSALQLPLTMNGYSVGNLSNGAIIMKDVDPGQYTIVATAPSVSGTSTFATDVAAGQTVFIKGETLWGWPAGRASVAIVSEAQARSEIAGM